MAKEIGVKPMHEFVFNDLVNHSRSSNNPSDIMPKDLYDEVNDAGLSNSAQNVLATWTIKWYSAKSQAERDIILKGIQAGRQYISKDKLQYGLERFIEDEEKNVFGDFSLLGYLSNKSNGSEQLDKLKHQLAQTRLTYYMSLSTSDQKALNTRYKELKNKASKVKKELVSKDAIDQFVGDCKINCVNS